MPQAFLSPDRMTAFCRLSRFGMTFKLLTDDLFEDALTWFLAGFPARTLAFPERAQELTANAPECGATWRGSLAMFDPVSCSWKTAQLSLLEDSEQCSVTWPRSGMTVDGLCWALPMSGRRTSGTDSGWWPTPCATDTSNRKPGDSIHISASGLPKYVAANGEKSQMRLSQAVRMWPTPTCQDEKNNGAPSQMERNTKPLNAEIGGPLNPKWVEWLMGWPLGWTDLRPLETDKSRNVQQQLGECLEECK